MSKLLSKGINTGDSSRDSLGKGGVVKAGKHEGGLTRNYEDRIIQREEAAAKEVKRPVKRVWLDNAGNVHTSIDGVEVANE